MRRILFLSACIALLGFGSISTSIGQSDRSVIRLSVEEVRLDAVVLDRKGRQVTDLRMDDFELRQGGVQIYAPGDVIDYAAIIYCTCSDGSKKPDLESQYVLYRDGKEFFRSNAEAVDLSGVIMIDFNRIPIRRKLVLEKSMQPGDYILALKVSDRTAKAKDKSVASQAFSFKMR
jgi:hypothetical protein